MILNEMNREKKREKYSCPSLLTKAKRVRFSPLKQIDHFGECFTYLQCDSYHNV